MLMRTKETVDYCYIAPEHEAIHARLENWARWVRVRPHGWFTHPMFKNFRTSKQWAYGPQEFRIRMSSNTREQPMTTEKPATTGASHIPSTQRVFDAVRDLREVDQIATRETVAELTGLKLSIVDDRLRALVDDGKLKRLLRGIYELVETWPEPRELSCTMLSTGWVKLELGDDLLKLTPTEARRAARALGGFAEDARVIETTRSHLFLATELAAKVESQGRELKTMRELLRGKLDTRQLDLLGIPEGGATPC